MDIIGGEVGGWLVIGWFTPDYRPLAEKFAANLDQRSAPYHLFAKPKSERGWNTWRKPEVVLETLDAYPGKTLVLMDLDCVVNGDVAPVADVARAADVGIHILPRQVGETRKIAVAASSRVVVFQPTAGARLFASEWQALCGSVEVPGYRGDEAAMVWAFLRLPHIAYAYLDPRYTGRELSKIGEGEDVVIAHDGVHDKDVIAHLSGWAAFKVRIKNMERSFLRTGRTKSDKDQQVCLTRSPAPDR